MATALGVAAEPPASRLPAAWRASADAVVRQALAASPWAGLRLVVEIGEPDPRLQLAPCTQVRAYLPPGLALRGRSRVGLRCEAGPKPWNISLPVTVQAWGKAWVARGPLALGTVVEAAQWEAGEADLAAGSADPVGPLEEAVGRTLQRPLAAGEVLRQNDLKARRWFAAGETVRLVALGPGWRVVSEGQALNPGVEGQTVRVRTESGRIVQGRPTADREVEVMP